MKCKECQTLVQPTPEFFFPVSWIGFCNTMMHLEFEQNKDNRKILEEWKAEVDQEATDQSPFHHASMCLPYRDQLEQVKQKLSHWSHLLTQLK